MNKQFMSRILNRYPHTIKDFKKGKEASVIYVGNRKEVIVFNAEIRTLFEIIDDVLRTSDEIDRCILRQWIKLHKSDQYGIAHVPFSRSSYYYKNR